jgi:hypothetical protein
MTEPLAVVWSRPLPEGIEPTTVTVSRGAAGRWFVSLLCEDRIVPLPKAPNPAVGIDAGITSLVTLSKMPLTVRAWTCACGATHDRDVNAAKNMEAAGLAVLACGAGVRPQGRKPGGRSASKQETHGATRGIPALDGGGGCQWLTPSRAEAELSVPTLAALRAATCGADRAALAAALSAAWREGRRLWEALLGELDRPVSLTLFTELDDPLPAVEA